MYIVHVNTPRASVYILLAMQVNPSISASCVMFLSDRPCEGRLLHDLPSQPFPLAAFHPHLPHELPPQPSPHPVRTTWLPTPTYVILLLICLLNILRTSCWPQDDMVANTVSTFLRCTLEKLRAECALDPSASVAPGFALPAIAAAAPPAVAAVPPAASAPAPAVTTTAAGNSLPAEDSALSGGGDSTADAVAAWQSWWLGALLQALYSGMWGRGCLVRIGPSFCWGGAELVVGCTAAGAVFWYVGQRVSGVDMSILLLGGAELMTVALFQTRCLCIWYSILLGTPMYLPFIHVCSN